MQEACQSAKRAEGEGITNITPSNWEVFIGSGEFLNFATHFQHIQRRSDELLRAYYNISPMVGASNFDVFASAVREISEKLENIRNDAASVSKIKKQVQKNASIIEDQKEQAIEKQEKISSSLEKANEMLAALEGFTQAGQSHLEQISEISNNANSLKSEVGEYEIQFQVFQKTLDSRDGALKAQTKYVESPNEKMKQDEEKISEQIKKAEDMLKGATNAGLAGVFSNERDELDRKPQGACQFFYFSIILLFLSVAPPAGLFFHQAGLIKAIWPNVPDFTGEPLTIITFSLLIIFPAIWLARFSAARHHQLFQLREYYQYKYSLAMSVEGFKKQAPEHADAIAAETFSQLLFNPGDRLTDRDAADDHPSPLMNWLMNRLGFNEKGE